MASGVSTKKSKKKNIVLQLLEKQSRTLESKTHKLNEEIASEQAQDDHDSWTKVYNFNKNDFTADSGATQHCCGGESMFTNFKQFKLKRC